MGMAASQGRLLFMTARISNNEFEQQCVAYSKQRLADDSQEANDQYLEALQATQYQVLSGYNGDTPTYEPVTYTQLTGLNNVATGKQYIVSDNKGQIVVTQRIAEAFENAHGDYNKFLKYVDKNGQLTQVAESNVTEQDVHNAWDKYFVSVNRGDENGIYYDEKSDHILGFSYHAGKNNDGEEVPYVTYNTKSITGAAGNRIYLQENSSGEYYYNNYEIQEESYTDELGIIRKRAYYVLSENLVSSGGDLNLMQDSPHIYLENVEVDENGNFIDINTNKTVKYVDQNYGTDIYNPTLTTEATVKAGGTNTLTSETNTIFYNGSTAEQRQLYDYAMAVSEKYANGSQLEYDADKVQYYKNIYDQMTTKGYTTFNKMLDEDYINTLTYNQDGTISSTPDETQAFINDNWLVSLLKKGKLSISFYNSTEKNFIKTTLDDDESIVNKENKSKMAIAEQVYNNHMDQIEAEDKRFDMQLTKLDSEHTALLTEYESVNKVISKNVEKSFSIFNA